MNGSNTVENRETHIMSELNQITSKVLMIEELSKKLNARLSSVLRSEAKVLEAVKVSNEPDENIVAFAAKLREQRYRLEGITSNLAGIFERLEI